MTDIVCKCGVSRLEEIQCAECGQYFKAGWIPVSERLPEKSEYYLALLMGWNIPTIASFSTYKNECLVKADDMWYVRIDGDWTGVETVTHWMPLPPPPEDE